VPKSVDEKDRKEIANRQNRDDEKCLKGILLKVLKTPAK
jgi:hypothetical protein